MKINFIRPVHSRCYGCVIYPVCEEDCEMIEKALKKVDRNCKIFDWCVYLIAILVFIIGLIAGV